ncbi:restriction endonuclease subunit S [Desulforhopalus vacuolatus]|uniref:restriction endonuclease subunit S n=1 Tax=Desulforhopalus vacuolatus TaxID=40414 RepID=UPI001962800C|nr:restriction endonuclease subunit S [Desulforhopalus vacuolatus]MBM9520923.1 restriction endonuclease subunit S [Desulforhopalus vacuolatus]
MGVEWNEYSLGEISENISRPFNFSGRESVVFINTGDVLKGDFLHANRSSPQGLPGQAKKRIVEGDILFSEIRPANRRYAEVTFDSDDYVVSTKFMVIRLTSKEVYQPFFLIQLTSEQTLREFQRIAESRSGTFPQITFDAISYYPFIFPPLSEQKAIAHILGSLDDKIELNRRMNATLEGMAQALFKSWFVDFDPVIDNALAAGNPIPEELSERVEVRRKALADGSVNREAAKQFPAAFRLTEEMGWIPDGWEVSTSGSLFDVKDGTHDSPKQSVTGKYLITSRHITGNNIDYSNAYLISEEDFEQVNKRSKVDPYDILLTMIGTVGSPFLVMEEEINFAIKNIGLFKTGDNRTLATYFFTYLKSDFMKAFMDSRLAGTTQKYLTLKILRGLPVISPHSTIMTCFGVQTLPIFDKIHSNNQATASLIAIRDTLLPKLTSGELSVPNGQSLSRNNSL